MSLAYPIGRCPDLSGIQFSDRVTYIERLLAVPQNMAMLVQNLNDDELEWIYRPDGWNIREVVHHCVDSHMNGLIRLKLALSEDNPTIRPYMEDRVAKLHDYTTTPIDESLEMLDLIHRKWARLFGFMTEEQYLRTYFHPEDNRAYTMLESLGNYVWHGEHHLAHVQQAIAHQGQF